MLLQRLILFAFAAILISLKADGRFPLPESLSETTFQLLLFPYTIVFVVTILFYFQRRRIFFPEIIPGSLIRWAAGICILFLTITVYIFHKAGVKYSEFGYHVNHLYLLLLYLISAALLIYLIMKKSNHTH